MKELVKTTQKLVNKLVPGVTISIERDADNNDKMLVGSYDCPKYGRSSHVERIDRFFTDASLFLMFFKQRIKYMNASKEAQLAFNGHPAFFGQKEEWEKRDEVTESRSNSCLGS